VSLHLRSTLITLKRSLLFPGTLIHEFSHLLFCTHFNVNIKRTNWTVLNGNELIYSSITDARHVTWIAYAPLFANPAIALILFAVALTISQSSAILALFVLWVAASTLSTAVPSTVDVLSVIDTHKETTLVTAMTKTLLPLFIYWEKGLDFVVFLAVYLTLGSVLI